MKKFTQIILLFLIQFSWSQADYSDSWEDFYSYNNVKDFIKVDTDIYAIVDNALFKYNIINGNITKISSVNGLSGESTSSIFYSKTAEKIVIGYETGLLEIIDKKGNITIAKDIVNFNYSGNKQINDITEFDNKLYISTSFAVVVYNIDLLQFGDTYFIGNQSSEIKVNQIKIANNIIYAATVNGIFTADVLDPNLIDYKRWTQNFTGDFVAIEVFDNEIFTSKARNLYTLNSNSIILQKTYSQNIRSLKASENYLTIATQRIVNVIDPNLVDILSYTTNASDAFYYNLNTAYFDENTLFLGTLEYGILKSNLLSISTFEEIHPEGPVSNAPFSISAKDNHLWVVYGGYDGAYTPLNGKYAFSHFNGVNWVNKPYGNFKVKNLVNITFDYLNFNKVYISSWGASGPTDISNTGGMLIVEDDEVVNFWNYTNSALEKVFLPSSPNYLSTRINGSAFDKKGNLWIANAWVDNRIKKYSENGSWSSVDMSSVMTNPALGLNELVIDKTNTIFIGSRRNGVLVYNENGNKKISLTTEENSGSLPDLNVRTLKTDARNRLWIGTLKGLVVLYNASGVFDQTIVNTEPIIILDDGVPRKLLGDQPINTISIDGADNKWFGTETGGALQTDPNGTTTLQNFNKNNSPLPSNSILKIAIDNNSGSVYFATTKGIVAFNSNVAQYGENLPEVYAFPNPSTKTNEFITIDGRNGTHLPKGTNIKILDTAGNLVFETNVKEGEELYGGKVIWNKTNLAGKKVASGVYIVLLSANENTETSVAKIAIIN
jgi:hypothetical protein